MSEEHLSQMRGAGEGNSLSFETSSSVLELLGVSPFQFSTHCRNWANQGGAFWGKVAQLPAL